MNKLQCVNVKCDPYSVKRQHMSQDIHHYPPITYPDMCIFLVASPNPNYNFESLQSHKSLQAHNFFLCGWVKKVSVRRHTSDLQPAIVRSQSHEINVMKNLNCNYSNPVCHTVTIDNIGNIIYIKKKITFLAMCKNNTSGEYSGLMNILILG